MFEIVALMLLSQQPLQPVSEGVASYYTVASSSQITASGEVLRDDELTCALPFGEFGEYYLIVSKQSGRSVVCRLNDRGPYVKGRVVDLSKAAMRELAGDAGLVPVEVYRLGADPPMLADASVNGASAQR